jgi:hypothetical protein
MNTATEIQNLLPGTGCTCFVIPSLFTMAECEGLLSPKIKQSFQAAIANYPTNYRNNDRFVTDNDELADSLFEKVKHYLPATIEDSSGIKAENGLWQLAGLNSRLRFCRYSANQYFNRHLDGVHYQSASCQSKLTFMVYLNGANDFGGGRTLFYKTKETDEVWASYIPRQGDLIVFGHNIWHEGEVLSAGEKFVLRSDILYTKVVTEQPRLPFEGHLGYIWKVLKFDESTILSGGRDKVINAWGLDGTLLQSLKGHNNSILDIEKMDAGTFISCSRTSRL